MKENLGIFVSADFYLDGISHEHVGYTEKLRWVYSTYCGRKDMNDQRAKVLLLQWERGLGRQEAPQMLVSGGFCSPQGSIQIRGGAEDASSIPVWQPLCRAQASPPLALVCSHYYNNQSRLWDPWPWRLDISLELWPSGKWLLFFSSIEPFFFFSQLTQGLLPLPLLPALGLFWFGQSESLGFALLLQSWWSLPH